MVHPDGTTTWCKLLSEVGGWFSQPDLRRLRTLHGDTSLRSSSINSSDRLASMSTVTATTARAQAAHGIEVHSLPSRPDLYLSTLTTDDRQDTQDVRTQEWTRRWTLRIPRCSTISLDPLTILHDPCSPTPSTPRHGSFLSFVHVHALMLPPSRSHVRIPWSGPIDNLDRLLRVKGPTPLWLQKAP